MTDWLLGTLAGIAIAVPAAITLIQWRRRVYVRRWWAAYAVMQREHRANVARMHKARVERLERINRNLPGFTPPEGGWPR